MTDKISAQIIRQLFILVLILFVGVLILIELVPYLSGVLGAITLYVLLQKFMVKLLRKNWNATVAALFLMLISFFCILVPIAGIALLLTNKISAAAKNFETVITIIKKELAVLNNKLDVNILSSINVNEMSSWVTSNLEGFLGSTFNIFISLGMMYFLLFYMLVNRQILRQSLYKYIPISKVNIKLIGKAIHAIVKSNAIGIPLVALAQGIIALIGFLIFDINNAFFWFVIVTFGSFIPFIGTLIGIIPVFIITLASGNTFAAWAILIYGFVVVGATDNILRLFILKRLDNVHPLITLIGVVVGVPLFGFIGLIFGPLLVNLFLIIVDIYRKEFGKVKHLNKTL